MAFDAEFFIALVEDENTVFDPVTHARRDLDFLGLTFEHEETSFAVLRVTTRNPLGVGGSYALGLLRPGQPRWCLFSWSLGGATPTLLMRGRLMGLPSDIFGARITIDYQARPSDFVAQKEALADGMRTLPWWDPSFYDEQQRNNVDLVLESRSAVWYVRPDTLEVSASDVLIGEGGVEVFLETEHRRDGLGLSLAGLATLSVAMDVELSWTQRAKGSVSIGFATVSYTLDADSYPKAGATFGEGWTVRSASVAEPHTFETRQVQSGSDITIEWWDGAKTNQKTTVSDDVVEGPGVELPSILTNYTTSSSYSEGKLTSWNVETASTSGLVPLHSVVASYEVGYDAARPRKEHVTYTLRADVQPTITLPENDEPERLEMKTSDLSEFVDGAAPIGDPRRRSYVATERGQQALFYTLLVARARLRRAARVADLTYQPFLSRLGDLRLDKNATVHHWQLPGGSATGKITKFTLTVQPPTESSGGQTSLSVTVGCAPGNGGVLAGADGSPTYAETDYCGEDYQEFDDRVLVFNDDVGLTVPLFSSDDDGLDFISGLSGANIFEVPVTIGTTAESQAADISSSAGADIPVGILTIGTDLPPPAGYNTWPEAIEAAVEARNQAVADALSANATEITFKLKSMTKEFTQDVVLVVEDLKVPSMIDLEAA